MSETIVGIPSIQLDPVQEQVEQDHHHQQPTHQKRPCRTMDSSVSVTEVPDDGFLVKTTFAALRTQAAKKLSSANRDGRNKTNILLSNEICGRVALIGNKVPAESGIKVGDVVIVYPWQGCRQCEFCSSGNSHLCEETTDDTDGNEPQPHPENSFPRHGLESYQLVYEWQNAVRLPRDIPGEVGCMLASSALKVYTAILEARPFFEQAVRIRGFSNLLVLGGGGCIELLCIHLMKSIFCDRNVKVICADRNPTAVKLASESGADDAVLLAEGASVQEMVDSATMNRYNKMDVVLDAIGDASSFAVALASLHHGGIALILRDGGDSGPVEIPMSSLVRSSITIKAIGSGSRYLFKQLVDLAAVQGLSTDALPVETFQLEQFDSTLIKLSNDEVRGRAVMRFE